MLSTILIPLYITLRIGNSVVRFEFLLNISFSLLRFAFCFAVRNKSGKVSWEEFVGLFELVGAPEGATVEALNPDLKEVVPQNLI